MPFDLKSMTLSDLEKIVAEQGYPKFRAKQIYEKLQNGAMEFSEINIPNELRQYLSENYFIATCYIEQKYVSAIDGTVKYLFRLYDGEFIESVLMKYHHGYTLCISTQVGCRMGCKFCASTLGGLVRNLYPSELLGQIQAAEHDMQVRISNIVMMGIGEPFDNFDNVLRFLELIKEKTGVNIGARHISLSTSGNIDGIRRLITDSPQITLSVSLHAPNDRIRSSIMPVNNKWNIEELITACREYIEKTNRRISFEYAMISGVNDTDECAYELVALLKGMLCHVNLIPANPVKERNHKKSSVKRQNEFKKILEENGLTVTVRRTLGADINASCGQLRRDNMKGKGDDQK